jgi:hypothetical protein
MRSQYVGEVIEQHTHDWVGRIGATKFNVFVGPGNILHRIWLAQGIVTSKRLGVNFYVGFVLYAHQNWTIGRCKSIWLSARMLVWMNVYCRGPFYYLHTEHVSLTHSKPPSAGSSLDRCGNQDCSNGELLYIWYFLFRSSVHLLIETLRVRYGQ